VQRDLSERSSAYLLIEARGDTKVGGSASDRAEVAAAVRSAEACRALRTKRPVHRDTEFGWAVSRKTFVAALSLRLAEQAF
jgi:hypothetical protein